MAKGTSVYLQKNELDSLLKVLKEWEDFQTEEIYAHGMQHGLGNAWRKLAEKREKLN